MDNVLTLEPGHLTVAGREITLTTTPVDPSRPNDLSYWFTWVNISVQFGRLGWLLHHLLRRPAGRRFT
jgi:hypothetical protein